MEYIVLINRKSCLLSKCWDLSADEKMSEFTYESKICEVQSEGYGLLTIQNV